MHAAWSPREAATDMCGVARKVVSGTNSGFVQQVPFTFVLALSTRTHRACSKSSCDRSLGIRQLSDDFKCRVSSGEKDGDAVVCLARETAGDLDETAGVSPVVTRFTSPGEPDKEPTSP